MHKQYAQLLVKCGFFMLALTELVQAQQTLTFNNTSVQGQPISVALLAGSTVTLTPTGSMAASCVLASGTTICAGLPNGGSGAAPSVSLAGGSYSQSPNTSGAYPAGTNVTITPTVSNAEVCVRSSSPTTPTTAWSGLLNGPTFGAAVVTLSSPSSAYQFSLRCYGSGGATTFNLPSISTQEGIAPPTGCSAPPPGQPTFVGFAGPARRTPPSGFLDLLAYQGGATRCTGDFPNTTSILCLIHTQRSPNNQYISLRFVAPLGYDYSTLEKFFDWDESQVRGAAQSNSTYVTISQCPGDFRIPPLGATAPSNDPTYAAGCRNLFNAGRIEYLTGSGPSTATKCMINPGETYYFNYVRGVPNIVTNQVESAECVSGSTECGVQMQIR
jgi:hypothetical protein